MKSKVAIVLCFFLTGTILFSISSCADNAGGSINPYSDPQTPVTGKISGKVIYSNLNEFSNSGIVVTLDKTDGLRSVSVIRAAKIDNTNNFSRIVAGNTVTSADGSYLFENLAEGTYTVYAASPYSSEKAVCTNVVVRAAETTIAENLSLTATGSIAGRITVDYSYSGNAGFLVFIAGTSYMAVTDNYGNYKISDVPAGNGYMVVAMKNDAIHPIDYNVTVLANDSVWLPDNNFLSSEFETSVQPGVKGDRGEDGEDGKDGLSIVWLGAFDDAAEISEPKYLDAYFNKTDGCSYIYTGTEWSLLAKSGKDGVSRNALAIGTLLSTEELTNQPVMITVNLTKTALEKKGYVYSKTEPDFTSASAVLNSEDFVTLTKDYDGKYKIMAAENGYYTIAVKDSDESVSYTQEQITNIDKTAPAKVIRLQARYDVEERVLSVAWTNPSDSDFVYANLSYKKNDKLQFEDIHITNGSYTIGNIGIDGSKYDFEVCAIDLAGNKSDISTVSVTPKSYSVGDLLLNDGTIVPYGDYNFTGKVVGVLYSIDAYGRPRGWLGIYNSASTNSSGYLWQKWHGINGNENFNNIWCSPSQGNTFTGDTDGSDNWEYIMSNGGSADDFPAFDYVRNYASIAGLTGYYSMGWYMPSLSELWYIYQNKNIINSVLKKVNGVQLSGMSKSKGYYWSSSEWRATSIQNPYVWYVNFFDGTRKEIEKSNNRCHVCCIRKFR